MGLVTLRRRIETLEKSVSARDEAAEARIQGALHHISQENLELLISATLALLRGRELTEDEAAAKAAYACALERECRPFGLSLRRTPDVATLISTAHLRQLSYENLCLGAHGLRAHLQGSRPTEAQLAALQVSRSVLEAQYRRAGFSSQAEFERWYGEKTGSRNDARRGELGEAPSG